MSAQSSTEPNLADAIRLIESQALRNPRSVIGPAQFAQLRPPSAFHPKLCLPAGKPLRTG